MSENVNSGYAYVTRDGDVLDLLCLRVYRRDGMMDAVKSANPHLHAVGVVYSAGIRIWFPPVDADEQSPVDRKRPAGTGARDRRRSPGLLSPGNRGPHRNHA